MTGPQSSPPTKRRRRAKEETGRKDMQSGLSRSGTKGIPPMEANSFTNQGKGQGGGGGRGGGVAGDMLLGGGGCTSGAKLV